MKNKTMQNLYYLKDRFIIFHDAVFERDSIANFHKI